MLHAAIGWCMLQPDGACCNRMVHAATRWCMLQRDVVDVACCNRMVHAATRCCRWCMLQPDVALLGVLASATWWMSRLLKSPISSFPTTSTNDTSDITFFFLRWSESAWHRGDGEVPPTSFTRSQVGNMHSAARTCLP